MKPKNSLLPLNQHPPHPPDTDVNILQCLSLFFGKHAQAEVSVLMGFVGGWHDEVLSGRQFEAGAYLSQVNESLRASFLCMCQEEILIQVHVPLSVKLTEK